MGGRKRVGVICKGCGKTFKMGASNYRALTKESATGFFFHNRPCYVDWCRTDEGAKFCSQFSKKGAQKRKENRSGSAIS